MTRSEDLTCAHAKYWALCCGPSSRRVGPPDDPAADGAPGWGVGLVEQSGTWLLRADPMRSRHDAAIALASLAVPQDRASFPCLERRPSKDRYYELIGMKKPSKPMMLSAPFVI